MILNKITPKTLALYGIMHTYDNYTVDSDNLMVNATVNIAYNNSDIDDEITSVNNKITALDENEDLSDETKDYIRDDYMEMLEVLNFLKDKLS